jgi:arginine N-succinyltransferase
MPRHPLYVAYLPQVAQDVIGKVHTATEPARRLLEQEGLYYEGFVDIFDAGPVLQARVNELRSVRMSELVQAQQVPAVQSASQPYLIANTDIQNYRIIASDSAPQSGRLQLSAEQLQTLQCAPDSSVRVMPLNVNKQ